MKVASDYIHGFNEMTSRMIFGPAIAFAALCFVNALAQLVGKDAVYFTMPCNGAHTGKNWTDDVYAEMRFAQRVLSGMARVQMRLISYFQGDT
jgi:hypothetical protein